MPDATLAASEEVVIEAAGAQDASAIRALLAASHLPLEDLTPDHWPHFVVARRASRLIGVAGLEIVGRFALLRSVAVAPEHRRRGMASQLVAELEAFAHAHGVEAAYLLTTTAEDFFARRGYQRTNRAAAPEAMQATTEFKTICPASAVCMMKAL